MDINWVEKNWRRARARTAGQLARGLSLRVWPISRIMHRRFRARLNGDEWHEINAPAKALLDRRKPRLAPADRKVLDDLRIDGIHATTVERYIGSRECFRTLKEEADALINRPEIQGQIERRKSKQGTKWYVVRVFGYKPQLPVPPALAAFVLNDRILGVVNSYLGLCCRLKYLDIWYNLPVEEEEPPIDSERWHRDNEDTKLIKLFLYLTDVDERMGPLTYLRGSQPGGRYGDVFPNDPPKGSFPPEGELEKIVPQEQVRACTGEAGTMLIYDACGFHFGGRTRHRPRILLTATFSSDAALDLLSYRLERKDQYQALSATARYAIRAPNA